MSSVRALVVYESMFGNTEVVARRIAAGIAMCGVEVETVEVGSAPTSLLDDVALLVVGGPTHAFGMSRARTRDAAEEQVTSGLVSTQGGIREWLELLEGRADVAAAAFDTHIRTRLPGSAAKGAAKRLRQIGFRLVGAPESFWVSDTRGPLAEGEPERAEEWGRRIAAEVREVDARAG